MGLDFGFSIFDFGLKTIENRRSIQNRKSKIQNRISLAAAIAARLKSRLVD